MSGRGFFLFLLLIAATAGFYYAFTQKPGVKPAVVEQKVTVKIKPFGGDYFFTRVELPVPQFMQADARWKTQQLGRSEDTLGSAGCAVASTAMILNFYGVDTDPSRLDKFLTRNGGYTPEGWINWEKAAEMAPKAIAFKYEGEPSYKLIDRNLRAKNPVIVRLRYPEGTPTHFVVICGKEGHDYLVRDPGRGSLKGIYKLREFGSDIEALRFYEKTLPEYELPALAFTDEPPAPKIDDRPEAKAEVATPKSPPEPAAPAPQVVRARPVEEVIVRARPVEE